MNNKLKHYESKDKYQDHIMDQYKLYVEMADRISQRRGKVNLFFLTLNTSILSILLLFMENKVNISISMQKIILFYLVICMLLLLWFLLVSSYKKLNSAKYKVIGNIEKLLPLSPFWEDEWKLLGEGKEIKKYIPLSTLEYFVPLCFFLFYTLILILKLIP